MAQPLDAMQTYQGYQTANALNALRAQQMQESAQMHPLQMEQAQVNILAKRMAMDDERRRNQALMQFQQTGNVNALAMADPKMALQVNAMNQRAQLARERMNMLGGLRGGRPIAVMGPDNKPVLVAPSDAIGKMPFNTREATAKLPTSALKMQQEDLDAIGTASSIDADLGAILNQVNKGEIKLGPVSNAVSATQNALGLSDAGSRNYASFRATLEKLRNDSLRLNKGVQTEGDAQRAWNEMLSSINDPEVVKQRLGEIKNINRRAANLRRMNIDAIRSNFGVGELDTSKFSNQPAAVGGPSTPGASGGWSIQEIK